MPRFLENARICQKFQKCQKIQRVLDILENAKKSKICQKFQQMLEILKILQRDSRKCQKSRICQKLQSQILTYFDKSVRIGNLSGIQTLGQFHNSCGVISGDPEHDFAFNSLPLIDFSQLFRGSTSKKWGSSKDQFFMNFLLYHTETNIIFDVLTLWLKGSLFQGPGPYWDLFYFFGPHWVPIHISGSLFLVFWLNAREECQLNLHVYNE